MSQIMPPVVPSYQLLCNCKSFCSYKSRPLLAARIKMHLLYRDNSVWTPDYGAWWESDTSCIPLTLKYVPTCWVVRQSGQDPSYLQKDKKRSSTGVRTVVRGVRSCNHGNQRNVEEFFLLLCFKSWKQEWRCQMGFKRSSFSWRSCWKSGLLMRPFVGLCSSSWCLEYDFPLITSARMFWEAERVGRADLDGLRLENNPPSTDPMWMISPCEKTCKWYHTTELLSSH